MAGGGDSNEMNPFISYVDLFASIILVLLLFILIMFVNVGYSIQFNTKNKAEQEQTQTELEKYKEQSVTAQTKKEKEEEQTKTQPVQLFAQTDNNNTTPVQGGETEGNTLTKKSEQYAQAEFKEQELIIAFKNNEYFLNQEITSQVTEFMESTLKKNPSALFYISVNDSKKLISSTQTKQVSLGRILSLKNTLEKIPTLQNKIKLNYKQAESLNYDYGYLKIDVK